MYLDGPAEQAGEITPIGNFGIFGFRDEKDGCRYMRTVRAADDTGVSGEKRER